MDTPDDHRNRRILVIEAIGQLAAGSRGLAAMLRSMSGYSGDVLGQDAKFVRQAGSLVSLAPTASP